MLHWRWNTNAPECCVYKCGLDDKWNAKKAGNQKCILDMIALLTMGKTAKGQGER